MAEGMVRVIVGPLFGVRAPTTNTERVATRYNQYRRGIGVGVSLRRCKRMIASHP